MASHPLGKCCVTGHVSTGETKGFIEVFNGTPTYVSLPPGGESNSKAILYLSDACGIEIPNTQLLADSMAAEGYTVIMPDLFHGNPHPINDDTVDLWAWLAKHPIDRVGPVVEQTLESIKKDGNFKWVGAVGYCFGAKYVVRFLSKGENRIDAGFVAHPSFVEAEELRKMKGPLSIAAAEHDYIFTTETRYESEKILKESAEAWQINLYSDVEHSFAVREDPNVRRQVWAKQQALRQALEWFEEYLRE